MFQEAIRLTIQKIFSDKLLFGLLIVCLLGAFVGGFNNKPESRSAPQTAGEPSLSEASSPRQAAPESKPSEYSADSGLQPDLAVDFIKWWMKGAMDYTPQSAIQSHQAAANWMTPQAIKSFEEAYWPPQLAQMVSSGQATGAFQPISVQAEAINPDKSVVVGLTGTLVLETGNHPTSHQINMDILVRRGSTGLRITGMYNHLTSLSPSIY